MPSLEKIDRSLRRLRKIEASWRSTIKRVHETALDDHVDPVRAKERYEKVRTKYERKIAKLQPKIRRMTHQRAELKGGRTGKD